MKCNKCNGLGYYYLSGQIPPDNGKRVCLECACQEPKEVCKWDISDKEGNFMFGCPLSYLTPVNAVKRYKVCPYCGKPILIQE